MEPTGINRGRSILRPIGDVLPDELTPHEAAWISKALELDFPGRNAIVEQLSHAKVARKTDDASDDIRFDAITDEPHTRLPPNMQRIAAITISMKLIKYLSYFVNTLSLQLNTCV